jgi:hypothetical protein
LEFVRRIAIPRSSTSARTTAVISGDFIVVSTTTSDRQHVFSLFDLNGLPIRSFGPIPRNLRENGLDVVTRPIADAGGGAFWAGPVWSSGSGFVLEKWDTAGRKLKTVVRDVSWFNDFRPLRQRIPEGESPAPREPPPLVSPENVDGDGLILVFSWVPHGRWTYGPGAQGKNVVIEVIDPDSDEVLASTTVLGTSDGPERLPRGFFRFTRLGYFVRQDGDGRLSLHIIEYGLAQLDQETR